MKWNTLDSLEHEALQDYTNLTEVAESKRCAVASPWDLEGGGDAV